jgi:hypothetical protein
MPTMRHMRIFMSFHHICLRTRLAPRRKPWADCARLSVLSCSESRRAPRSETLLMLSRIIPTVLSISYVRVSMCVAQGHGVAERLPQASSGVASILQGCGKPECVPADVAMMRTACTLSGAADPQETMRRCWDGGTGLDIPPEALLCGGCHSGLGPRRLAGQRWECMGRTAARGRP